MKTFIDVQVAKMINKTAITQPLVKHNKGTNTEQRIAPAAVKGCTTRLVGNTNYSSCTVHEVS